MQGNENFFSKEKKKKRKNDSCEIFTDSNLLIFRYFREIQKKFLFNTIQKDEVRKGRKREEQYTSRKIKISLDLITRIISLDN